MYSPYYPQYGDCVWNNVEGLIGDSISFIVCRTMLKLPADKPDIGKLRCTQKRNILEKVINKTNPQEVIGQLMIDINYEPVNINKGNRDKLKERNNENKTNQEVRMGINIPYRGILRAERHSKVIPQVKYLDVRQVGLRDIYIEGIIALTGTGQQLKAERDAITESFLNTNSLRLAENYPDIQEPIASQIHFTISKQKLKDGILTVKGTKEMYLMYISNKDMGENVVIAHEVSPFTQEIYLNSEPSDQGDIEITSTGTVINIVNKREVVIEGDYLLKIHHVDTQAENAKLDILENNLNDAVSDLPKEKENTGHSTLIREGGNLMVPEESKKGEIRGREIARIEEPESKETEGISFVRESKKAKLAKYMKKN